MVLCLSNNLKKIALSLYRNARYFKMVKIEGDQIIDIYRSPSASEISKIADKFGDVRGVLLGNELVVWTEDLKKGDLVKHTIVVKTMNWGHFIPLVFNVPDKTVQLSSWAIHSTGPNIKAMEDKTQDNSQIKALKYKLIETTNR